MVPFRIDDHVERGLSLTLSQYRRRPIFEAWLASYLRQVQALEDAAYDVLVSRFLDRARNAQLDMIGKLVGEARGVRDDDAYRPFIAARIRINRSFGRLEDILAVYNIVSSAPKRLVSVPPANLLLEIGDVPTVPPAELDAMLRATKAGGVGFLMVVPTAPPATQFRWGDDGCETAPSAQGFGDENVPSSGGRLSDSYL